MSDANNGHVLRLSRRSIPVWCYVTLWEGDAESADFCSLFWATVFAPLGALLWVISWLLPRSAAKTYQAAARTKALGGVARGGDRVAAFFQGRDALVGFAIVVVGVGLLIFWAITNLAQFAEFCGLIVIYVSVVIIASKTQLGRFLRTGVHAVKSRTCPRVEIVSKDGED